jgi:hypothetical protein
MLGWFCSASSRHRTKETPRVDADTVAAGAEDLGAGADAAGVAGLGAVGADTDAAELAVPGVDGAGVCAALIDATSAPLRSRAAKFRPIGRIRARP